MEGPVSALRDKLLEWLVFNSWIIESALAVLLTVALFVFWGKVQYKIRQQGDRTDTPWDNIIIQAVGAPLSLLIVLLGVHYVVGTLAFAFIERADAGETYATLRAAAVLVTFFWVLLRIINGFESHYRRRNIWVGNRELNPGTLYAAFQTLRGVIFVVALLTAMEAVGLSVSGLLAFGGIGGILIGFAAKDTLANFFSGLLIFWERPFVVGDWIRRPDANIEGVVEDIGWRMTQIRTFDQRPLYVPNSLFFNSVIENPQRMTNRRIYEYMGVRYDDIERMPAMLDDIRKMLLAHDGIDQEKIQMVNFDRYGASSLDFFIYAMTKTTDWGEFHRVKEDVLLRIAAIVSAHNCEFAFPTRTLHHQTAPPPLS